jgi:Tudor domain
MIADYAEFKKMRQQQMRPIARNLKPAAPPKFSTKATPQEGEEESHGNFKSNVIAHHTVHKIRISHFEKGVNLFYVQLESMDANLQALTSRIHGIQLRNLSKRPSSHGMACLARYNKKVYRVAVAKSNENTQNREISFLCHFVDFGFSSYVKFDNLFYIPQDCIEINAFAIPFCLAGLKNVKFQASFQEVNFYFQQICENRLLTLKCVQLDGNKLLKRNNINIKFNINFCCFRSTGLSIL